MSYNITKLQDGCIGPRRGLGGQGFGDGSEDVLDDFNWVLGRSLALEYDLGYDFFGLSWVGSKGLP